MIVHGRPPNLQSISQSWRFLTKYTWFNDKLPKLRKVFLTLAILEHTIRSPIFGFFWIFDEILYGRQMQGVKLDDSGDENTVGMVFVVSGYRSASTHLARSLVLHAETEQKDEASTVCVAAPNSMMISVPFLWIWKFVTWFLGDLKEAEDAKSSTPDPRPHALARSDIQKYYREKYSKECLERHDFDPFMVDTFDLSFLSNHLNSLAWQYCLESGSPEVVAREFHYGKHTLENRGLYEKDFVRYIDRLARKTVLFQRSYQSNEEAAPKTTIFLLKGHFLSIVPALREKYPNAKFVTVLRDPCDRLRSAINYTAVNPSISGSMNPQNQHHWHSLAKATELTEAEYCQQEAKIFHSADNTNGTTEDQPPQFLSIHYDALAKTDTIPLVFQWLAGNEGLLSPSSSSSKNGGTKKVVSKKSSSNKKKGKKSKQYMVDKTLCELGIDEKEYKDRLSDYFDYMKEVGTKKIQAR
jgi:hypothetical protein